MKTIFINLFSPLAFNNLAIPGGVLGQLIKNKDSSTKIVFLASEGLGERISSFLIDDNVIVEFIKKVPPSGIIQKLFHFFYSYLIFTGTTKILATFGARADIPPAGGNRHLAPIKFLIANTFGQSKFIKNKFVPWAFKNIFSSRPYRRLFDKYNPDLVFLPNIAFFPDLELLSESRRRSIKTIAMACNWDHTNKYFIPLRADYFLAQNEPMAKEAVYLQAYKEEQVIPVGFPQFDSYIHHKDFILPREKFFKKLNLDPDSKIILFISGAAYFLDEPDILRTLSDWIKEEKLGPKTRLLVRPYVTGRDKLLEEKKYKEFQNNPVIVFNWQKNSESQENRSLFMSMFYYADVVISLFSTTSIEAAFFDKPILCIGFDGYKKRPKHKSIARLETMSHLRHILDTGAIRISKSFSQLFEDLAEYLQHPEEDKEKRLLLIEKMNYKLDGLASKRVVDFVKREIKNIN